MTFWQENYTFIKEVYDTRWVAWPWWAVKAHYLKQRANYWALFVLWYQETGGGRFSCRTYFERRPYYGPISLRQSSHRGAIIIKPQITPNPNSEAWMALPVPRILYKNYALNDKNKTLRKMRDPLSPFFTVYGFCVVICTFIWVLEDYPYHRHHPTFPRRALHHSLAD